MKKNMKKNMLWMLLSLMAAAIMMPLNATAQTRIAVVSDIHVMAPSLLDEINEDDWNAYYSGQRKMLEQSAGLFDQFINKMKDEKPDILLITGDLTKDGEQASHLYVRNKLAELKTALPNIKIYVIPGNHDFGGETDPLGNDPTKGAAKLSTSFASYYAAYGYTGSECNGDSYIAQIDNDLYLLAIDSHDDGSVSQATLDWIQSWIQENASGKRFIAMMHHPLFPHITGANMFIDTYAVKYQPTTGDAETYETVRNKLINAGVNVILTGHFHTSDIAYDWIDNPTDETDKSNGIYDINTGSLISYPCDYRMLTLSADKKTLSVKTKSLTETPALIPSGSESWKDWMNKRVKSVVSAKIIREHPEVSDNTFAKAAINQVAQFAAKLFILHAEGNEPNSPENNTYETLYSQASMYANGAKIYNIIIDLLGPTHSILEDKSNYSNNHVNQTNDRTLTINLDSPSSLLLELDNNDDNNSVINYYSGKTATVTLTGRTLYKDGFWNTICLPFSLSAEKINTSLLAGADIRALNTADFDNENNALILNFTPEESVTTIEAGRPYIIKWASGDNITTDLTFDGVTIDNTPRINGNENVVTFVGTYQPILFDIEDNSKLLIGQTTTLDNKVKSSLFYPKTGASIGAFRAYFQLADSYTAGDPYNPGTGGGDIRNFVLNFGDDDSATGIIAIGGSQLSTLNAQRSEWFTLDGRRLAAKPTAKGLYIHAGRKVVIK